MTAPDRISGIAAVKTQMLVEGGHVIDGLIMRKGNRLLIVTNAGRVENYLANEYGAIDLEASQQERRDHEEMIQKHFARARETSDDESGES